jgi:hypothetical protein
MRDLSPTTMMPIETLSDDEFAHLVQCASALPDAPAHCVRSAIGLWRAPTLVPASAVATAALRLIKAVLSFDSWAQPALAAGVRSAGSDTRHLLFNAQGRDVDLRIAPSAGAFVLSGQILGPDETGVLELADCAAATVTRSASLDDLGEFRIDGIGRGTYHLTLRVGDDQIDLPAIEIGGPNR